LATKSAQGTILDAWSYQYDPVGNRISKTGMDGKLEAYSYDNVYRLTQASYADGSRESFTYDPAGNRLTRTDESGTTIQYSYDVANQLLSAGSDTFTYDANGSMLTKTVVRGTTTLVYDAKNRVTSINGPDGNETSLWGPDGQRVQMTGTALANETGGAIRPIYDLAGNPFADADTGSGIVRYRVYGPAVDEPLVEVNLANGAKPTAYLHHDALGSITCATDPNGNVVYRNSYRAFGQRTSTTTPNTDTLANAFTRLSYTSRETSVGSLYQYRSRYYDAGYGRFTSQDSNVGDELIPPSLHRYTYALNNPVRYTDPTGRYVIVLEVALIGLIVVTAALATYTYVNREALVSSATNAIRELDQVADSLLGWLRITVAFAQATTLLLLYGDDEENIIPFPEAPPTVVDIPTYGPEENDICKQRFQNSYAWILEHFRSDPDMVAKLVEVAWQQRRRCVQNLP